MNEHFTRCTIGVFREFPSCGGEAFCATKCRGGPTLVDHAAPEPPRPVGHPSKGGEC